VALRKPGRLAKADVSLAHAGQSIESHQACAAEPPCATGLWVALAILLANVFITGGLLTPTLQAD